MKFFHISLRVLWHERRNELKPVWDFISVENLTAVFSQLFTCVYMNCGKMKLKTVWIWYWSIWPKWNFKPAWDFHVNIIYRDKTNKCWLIGFCHYCTCAFETQCGYGFHISHFDRNDIPFWLIKYHVNTTQNEMPTHVHQNIGSFWNAGKMKLHVNRTCFYAGLKSQTGMSLFCLSCEHTLR